MQKNFFVVQKTEEYVIHMRALKQALNNGLKIKKGTHSNQVYAKSMVKTL